MQDTVEDYRYQLDNLITDVTPIITDIAKKTKQARVAMDRDPVDILTLSKKSVELSILLQRLASREARMGHINRASKEFYERTRENHKVRLVADKKMAAGVADSMKLDLSKDEFSISNDCQEMMDKIVYVRKSTDKTIDAIRSKVSYEKVNERNAQ